MFLTYNYPVVTIVLFYASAYMTALSLLLDWVRPRRNYQSKGYLAVMWLFVLNLAAFPLTPPFLTKFWALEGILNTVGTAGWLIALTYNIFTTITYLLYFKRATTIGIVKWGKVCYYPSSTLVVITLLVCPIFLISPLFLCLFI